MSLEKPYDNIPVTVIFDADMSRKDFHLNQFCMSLIKSENRKKFKSDEEVYLDEWKLTDEQKQAVLDRDFNRMIQLGKHLFFSPRYFPRMASIHRQAVQPFYPLSSYRMQSHPSTRSQRQR